MIFIPTDGATPNDVITNILGSIISMMNLLFECKKYTLLILTKENKYVNVAQVLVVYEFPGVIPENVTSLPP